MFKPFDILTDFDILSSHKQISNEILITNCLWNFLEFPKKYQVFVLSPCEKRMLNIIRLMWYVELHEKHCQLMICLTFSRGTFYINKCC